MELDLDWRTVQSEVWPEVSYELRPLRVWAFRDLMAFWEKQGAQTENENAIIRMSPVESFRLMELAERILPDHVRALKGVSVKTAGERATPEIAQLCQESALIPLAGEMVAKLVSISQVEGEPEKK